MNKKQIRKKAVAELQELQNHLVQNRLRRVLQDPSTITKQPKLPEIIKDLIAVLEDQNINQKFANLTESSDGIKTILDLLTLTEEEKGYLMYYFLTSNFIVIDSSPYRYVELTSHEMDQTKLVELLCNFLQENKLDVPDSELSEKERYIKKLLLREEQKRLKKVSQYTQIREVINRDSKEAKEKLATVLKELAWSEENIALLKNYLEVEAKAKKRKPQPATIKITPSPRPSNPTPQISKREEKRYYFELNQIRKKVEENHEPITIEEYLHYIGIARKLQLPFESLQQELAVLFQNLESNARTYLFFYDKALEASKTQPDLCPVIKEIQEIFQEMMICDEEEYVIWKETLLNDIQFLQKRIQHEFTYERILTLEKK